jgi:hypothetical protein
MIEKSIKRNSKISFSLFLVLFIIFPHLKMMAQCDPGSLSRECINKISEGFIYLKSFSIDGQENSKEKIEYTVVMSKDTHYAFRICTSFEGADGIILTIYDSNRNEIISNQQETVVDPEINYMCNSTGIYYISFVFLDSKSRCGGCILSFKKSQD